jgi:carboxypeptidase C (cathepsin A)
MFAGRIPTNHFDGKLMFWLYESFEPSSINKLTIWLNGGPGCSSFGGMLLENAPVTIPHYESGKLHSPTSPHFIPNEYSWTQHTHMLYVEQPAGTGFSSVCCMNT